MYFVCLVIKVYLYGTASCDNLRVALLGTNSSSLITDEEFDFAYLGAAVPVAFNTAKTNFSLLNNRTIEIFYAATECDEKLALDSFIKLKIDHDIDAALGLQCWMECYIIAILASQWNIPVISHSCTYAQTVDSSYFTTFLGTSVITIGDAVVAILLNFNWARAVLVRTVETDIEIDTAGLIMMASRENNISITSIINTNKTEEDILQRITNDARSKSDLN